MKKIISITEVADRFGSGPEEIEFRATADAQYDEAKNRLIVDLKSFIHPENCSGVRSFPSYATRFRHESVFPNRHQAVRRAISE